MLLPGRSWMIAIVALLGIACTGCPSKTDSKPAEKSPQPTTMLFEEELIELEQPIAQPMMEDEHQPMVESSKPQAPLPPLMFPQVALSGELSATCLVNVDDTMPEAELPDLAGTMHDLSSLYGPKLTVVCFWTIGTTRRSQLVAVASLRDLMSEVVEPFGPEGVYVIGINVGDPPEAVEQEAAQAGETFPCLLDPRGEYFRRIAADNRMPRTFLLDATGRILWFDVEYSRPSRRELLLCIQAALGEL